MYVVSKEVDIAPKLNKLVRRETHRTLAALCGGLLWIVFKRSKTRLTYGALKFVAGFIPSNMRRKGRVWGGPLLGGLSSMTLARDLIAASRVADPLLEALQIGRRSIRGIQGHIWSQEFKALAAI